MTLNQILSLACMSYNSANYFHFCEPLLSPPQHRDSDYFYCFTGLVWFETQTNDKYLRQYTDILFV